MLLLEYNQQKLLEQLHKRYSKILEYEAQHVSVMVAGPHSVTMYILK